tara:strand:+ start:575 stop:1510 length:936 start_codon:yes stop_codon:yes gene_type:complete
MTKKVFLLIIIINLIFYKNVFSVENKILLKIDNEIVTSIDVFNETKYLKAINSKINEMKKEDIYKISINSLIKRKIKEIEIKKNASSEEINIDDGYLNELIRNTYKQRGFNNLNAFNNHLKNYDIRMSDVKEIISTESLWNELIYQKFSKKIKINKVELKKKITKDNNKKFKSFLISEIVFKISGKETLNQKFNIIKKDINEKGFSNAATLHSISDSGVSGGELGWFVENSLNPKIKDKIVNLKIGDYTNPVIIPGGFLIIKLNNIKEDKIKYDIDKKLKDLIRITTNQQLNQLSNIYFDKIKKEIKIEKL